MFATRENKFTPELDAGMDEVTARQLKVIVVTASKYIVLRDEAGRWYFSQCRSLHASCPEKLPRTPQIRGVLHTLP